MILLQSVLQSVLKKAVLVNAVNNESGMNMSEIVTYIGVTSFEFARSEEEHEIPVTLCTKRNVSHLKGTCYPKANRKLEMNPVYTYVYVVYIIL
jgi:hypothetical protein